eukprot:5454298-Prymnesium_polylepis.1
MRQLAGGYVARERNAKARRPTSSSQVRDAREARLAGAGRSHGVGLTRACRLTMRQLAGGYVARDRNAKARRPTSSSPGAGCS